MSRPGRESRHNLTYWQDGEWLAFGSGAHGARGDHRWRNVAGTGEYITRVRAGLSAVASGRRATPPPGAKRPSSWGCG